jgi:NAD(P)-dependent dehydrogenase (short-subunit alcohol dehydrogenase family)
VEIHGGKRTITDKTAIITGASRGIGRVHFKSVYFLTQKLLPLMNDGGRIVNISSGLTRFSLPGSSAYAAARGAVEVLTRYLAKELGPRGITANVVRQARFKLSLAVAWSRTIPKSIDVLPK